MTSLHKAHIVAARSTTSYCKHQDVACHTSRAPMSALVGLVEMGGQARSHNCGRETHRFLEIIELLP